jgi:hypothetical protein
MTSLELLTLRNNQFAGTWPQFMILLGIDILWLDETLVIPEVIFDSTFEESEFTGQPRLLHRWNFNSNAEDSVGSADAILINGAFIDGTALSLDGSDQYAELPIQSTLANLSSLTMEAWLTVDSVSYWSRIFDFGANLDVNFFANVKGAIGNVGAAITTGGNATEQRVNGVAEFPTGIATHFALTIDAESDTAVLYINGSPVDTQTWTLTPQDLGPLTNLWLGRSQYDDPYLDGHYDEFRIYKGALTEEMVIDSYVAGPDGL